MIINEQHSESESIPFTTFISLQYSAGGSLATRVISQRCGAAIAWAAHKIGLSPNFLTLLSLFFCSSGSAGLVLGDGEGLTLIAPFLLWQCGYALDCADGQLARAIGKVSIFGSWLDPFFDIIERNIFSAFCLIWLLERNADIQYSVFVAFSFAGIHSAQIFTACKIRMKTNQRIQTVGFKTTCRELLKMPFDFPVFRTAFLLCAIYGGEAVLLILSAASFTALFHSVYTAYHFLESEKLSE